MKETEVTVKLVQGFCGVMDCHARKRHSGKFGSGDPDIHGVFRGHAFFVETKKVGGELTRLQADRLEQWRKVGAAVFVFAFKESTKSVLPIRMSSTQEWSQFVGFDGFQNLVESVDHDTPTLLTKFPYEAFLETEVEVR